MHARAGRYVSDATFTRYRQQKRRIRRLLEILVAINELGEEIALDEIADHSLANPAIRRAELMVRIRGFDQVSIELGHVAMMVTITCPSRMHSHRAEDGAPNPRFDPEATPKDAQAYMRKLWSRIRSCLQRRGIRPYGFRITEAHHDGTPHWHLLLFIEPRDQQDMLAILRKYALADSPDEPGAAKHRFQVEMIDRAKGSAVSYVAKYVSKNIDGHGLEAIDGEEPPATNAERIAAWASTWDVRQFQQIGGPPVGVWRELRRAPELCETPGIVGKLADAANRGDWRLFVMLMGGPSVRRKDLPINLHKDHDSRLNRYGEPIGERVTGITCEGEVFPTRLHTWSIERKAPGNDSAPKPERAKAHQSSKREEQPQAVASPTWTRVNNCTQFTLNSRVETSSATFLTASLGTTALGCSLQACDVSEPFNNNLEATLRAALEMPAQAF